MDVDDTELATLTITPAGVVDNNELLTIVGDAGAVINVLLDGIPLSQTIDINGTTYTVAYDGTDIVVTDPAGEIPLADAQTLLAATTYLNDDPTPTLGDRTFDITVNDGDADSNTATSTITVATDIATTAWSISGAASVDEGASTTYTVTLDNALLQSGEQASVDLGLTDGLTSSADYASVDNAVVAAVAAYNTSGQPGSVAWDGTTLVFISDGTGPMGDLDIVLDAVQDTFVEGPEDYTIALSNSASLTGETVSIDPSSDSVTTTIADVDPTGQADGPGEWSVTGPSNGDEGSTPQYTVALTGTYGEGEVVSLSLIHISSPRDRG